MAATWENWSRPWCEAPSLPGWEILLGAADAGGRRWRRLREKPPLSHRGLPGTEELSRAPGIFGWGADRGLRLGSLQVLKRKGSGFILPVSRGGWNQRDEELVEAQLAWPRARQPLPLSGVGGCPRAVQPAAGPTPGFTFPGASCLSLVPSLFPAPPGEEGRRCVPACTPFSPSPSILQTARAAGGSTWV